MRAGAISFARRAGTCVIQSRLPRWPAPGTITSRDVKLWEETVARYGGEGVRDSWWRLALTRWLKGFGYGR